jgi:hypothetical protein
LVGLALQLARTMYQFRFTGLAEVAWIAWNKPSLRLLNYETPQTLFSLFPRFVFPLSSHHSPVRFI